MKKKVGNNMTPDENKKSYISKVEKALNVLNNECLKIRDMQRILTQQGQLEAAKHINDVKEQYYNLLHYTYRFLYRTGWVEVTGFYVQKFIYS